VRNEYKIIVNDENHDKYNTCIKHNWTLKDLICDITNSTHMNLVVYARLSNI